MFREMLMNPLQSRPGLHFAPPPPLLAQVAGALVQRHGEGDAPRKSPAELRALLERLRHANFEWDNIRAVDRYDIAWVLWDGPEPPAEHEAFLAAFLHWAETPWRRFQIRRIAASWADAFDPRLKTIRVVGAWLAARAARLLEPWPALAENREIFFADRAPLKLAERFLVADESEHAYFERLGLDKHTPASGLRLETLGAAADIVREKLVQWPSLAARLAELAFDQPAFHPGLEAEPYENRSARIRSIQAKIAEALLLPWQSKAPPPAVKQQIIRDLLRLYADPRIREAVWRDLQPAATNLMRLWLKQKTIASFFHLVGPRKAETRAATQVRLDFWMSYIDRIDEAWLVADSQSFAALDMPNLGYGRLVGCRPGHCALLLKIGGLTIVETSHTDNERVWLAGNELAPPLYHERSRAYCPAMFTTGADFSSGYSCNDGGRWQERLGSFIARHAGSSHHKKVAA